MTVVLLGLICIAAGLGVATYSGILAVRAAAGKPLPLWRNVSGYHRPRSTQILQLVAALIVGLGAILCSLEWGLSAIFLCTLVFVPPFLVAAVHNRSISSN